MSYSILSSFKRGALAKLLSKGFSLREISKKLEVSPSTFSYELKHYDSVLAQKDADDKRKKRKNKHRGTFKISQTIEKTDYINNRSAFGNWEVDTVLSSRGQDKACLATFLERKSRLLWAIKIPDRSKSSMKVAFKKFISTFKSSVRSITVDHGKEFS